MFSTDMLTNPVNIALALCMVYYIHKVRGSRQASAKAASEAAQLPRPTVLRHFTPHTLLPYNGVDSEKIYMGVNGKVYDVTRGAQFYGPDGPYGNFGTRDASRGLAKHSFDKDMLTDINKSMDDLRDLKSDELDALRDWESHFAVKYDHVGWLVNEYELNSTASEEL
ncbi:Dihydrodipicolinate synthase [Sorochytrium milnesiophthora]